MASSTKKIFHIITYLLVILIVCQESGAIQRLCGRALPEALDSICIRGYNSKVKKSLDMDDYGAYNDIDEDLPFPYANSPFLAKIHGGGADLMAKTRRRRHGVYDECCKKGCTVAELVSYCL